MYMDCVTKQMDTDVCQASNIMPMVSHDDYGEWLLLILIKPEVVRFHRIGDRDILCEKPCSLCAKGDHPIESLLLPVYIKRKDVMKLLQVDIIQYPGSLFEQMCKFHDECNKANASVYCHAFCINEADLIPDCRSQEERERHDSNVFIIWNWIVPFCQTAFRNKEAVAQFLNNYKPGDLKMSAGFCCESD
jgi:hypothetical protein